MNLKEVALKELEDLEKKEKELRSEITKIVKEKAATIKFLQAKGLMEIKKRGRRKKSEEQQS